MSAVRYALLVACLALLLAASHAYACSMPTGYFHEVTALRGQVVGARNHFWPRWLRQQFVRPNARLTLYEYRRPIVSLTQMPLVKSVTADSGGRFDFGSLQVGHYTLAIDNADWGLSDWYDVEVKAQPRATESVLIDVSPNLPDCSGGHEFIVKT